MFEVGQWQTPTLVPAEAAHLVVVEVDAVGEPDPVVQPAAFLEIVDRPATEMLEAVFVLVARLAEMGVEPAVVALGEAGRCRPSAAW